MAPLAVLPGQPDPEIRQLLETWLRAMPGCPPVQAENAPFASPADKRYLRATLSYNDQEVLSISSSYKEAKDSGLFLVDCFTPEDVGPGPAEQLVAMVRARFAQGTILAGPNIRVRITGSSRSSGKGAEPGDPTPAYFVPVSIGWWTTYRPI